MEQIADVQAVGAAAVWQNGVRRVLAGYDTLRSLPSLVSWLVVGGWTLRETKDSALSGCQSSVDIGERF